MVFAGVSVLFSDRIRSDRGLVLFKKYCKHMTRVGSYLCMCVHSSAFIKLTKSSGEVYFHCINIIAMQFSAELTKSKKCESPVYSVLVISSP